MITRSVPAPQICLAIVVILKQVEESTPLPTKASPGMKGDKWEHRVQVRGGWA